MEALIWAPGITLMHPMKTAADLVSGCTSTTELYLVTYISHSVSLRRHHRLYARESRGSILGQL